MVGVRSARPRAGVRRRSPCTATTTRLSSCPTSSRARSRRYAVDVDGSSVWPPVDSPYPPSRVATLKPDRDLRLAFGSCRTSIAHDEEGNQAHGVDAMRAYALHMAGSDAESWPDLVAFLGDQVYADLTSPAMQEFIASRRDPSEPPGEELKDYEEYAHLYKLAWSDPANRWLLSTLPSSMIFDDHDIRDDWNTSLDWRQEMEQTSWWKGRVDRRAGRRTGSISTSATSRRRSAHDDEIWSQICSRSRSGDDPAHDFGPMLDAFAERADAHPGQLPLELCPRCRAQPDRRRRLAGRPRPDARATLDPRRRGAGVARRADGRRLRPRVHRRRRCRSCCRRGCTSSRHGTRRSPRARGERGSRGWARRSGERSTWSTGRRSRTASEPSPTWCARSPTASVAPAPSTITFLSGDVHNSYVAEVDRRGSVPGDPGDLLADPQPAAARDPLPGSVLGARTSASASGAGLRGSRRCRRHRSAGAPCTGRGSTTTWRRSRPTAANSGSAGRPASSRTTTTPTRPSRSSPNTASTTAAAPANPSRCRKNRVWTSQRAAMARRATIRCLRASAVGVMRGVQPKRPEM